MPATEFCCLMNLTRRLSGSTKPSSQMPRSPRVPQPRRSTFVDSMMTRPAPPAANLPAFIRCQSVGYPFTAEYWRMGGTTMRLRSSVPRMLSGENSKLSDMTHFLVGLWNISGGCVGHQATIYGARWRRQRRNPECQPTTATDVACLVGTRRTRYPKDNARQSSPRGESIMNEISRIPPAAIELGAGSEEFQNLHELIRKARGNLNQNCWDYIVGAAETETTM